MGLLSNEQTTRSDVVTLPGEIEALVATPGRDDGRPVVDFLRREGLNVTLVHDSDSAFEEALLHRPNLLLIHQHLPPQGGVELCQRLKANTRTHFLPTILVATELPKDLRLRAIAAGADAVFGPRTAEDERRARLWALLRSQTLQRREERRRRVQGSALRTRGQWLEAFVHDLHNALGALSANFEFLSRAVGRERREGSADLADCERETRSLLAQLTRGLRIVQDFERFESGRVKLDAEPVELVDLLAHVKDELALHVVRPSPPLRFAPVAAGLATYGDPPLLRRAIALLAAYLLRRPAMAEVEVSALREGEDILIRIAGDGPRLNQREREHLFEPYARIPHATPVAHGLGLALAKTVIDLHGGAVAAIDDGHGGTAFVVQLKSYDGTPNRLFES